jgi:hypothetical protein
MGGNDHALAVEEREPLLHRLLLHELRLGRYFDNRLVLSLEMSLVISWLLLGLEISVAELSV